jgi:hypothetical protein
MPDKNFSVKWTHTEATDVADALEAKFEALTDAGPLAMSVADVLFAGRIQTILQRDFDIVVKP